MLRLSRRLIQTKQPDPTSPRYFDSAQSGYRGQSQAQFRAEQHEKFKMGDKKRSIPLKTLVPEEYRGARYYTDREMEYVDQKNAKPRLFMGPYSIFMPHRDGRIECEGDRVPCNRIVQQSYRHQTPLALEPGFTDQSRYGKFTRDPATNPRHADQIEMTRKWLLYAGCGALFYYKWWFCPVNGVEFGAAEWLAMIAGWIVTSTIIAILITTIRFRVLRPIVRFFFR